MSLTLNFEVTTISQAVVRDPWTLHPVEVLHQDPLFDKIQDPKCLEGQQVVSMTSSQGTQHN